MRLALTGRPAVTRHSAGGPRRGQHWGQVSPDSRPTPRNVNDTPLPIPRVSFRSDMLARGFPLPALTPNIRTTQTGATMGLLGTLFSKIFPSSHAANKGQTGSQAIGALRSWTS